MNCTTWQPHKTMSASRSSCEKMLKCAMTLKRWKLKCCTVSSSAAWWPIRCSRVKFATGTTCQILNIAMFAVRSEEHTSELQSRFDPVCRLLLEKKNKFRAALLCRHDTVCHDDDAVF